MSRLRFLLDEHLAHAIQSRLLQLNIEHLYLLWIASEAEEYLDRVLYLPM